MYSVVHRWPDGREVERVLTRSRSSYTVTVLVDGEPTDEQPAGEAKIPLLTVLAGRPELLTVCDGVTDITIDQADLLGPLLGLLRVDSPDSEPLSGSDWRLLGDDSPLDDEEIVQFEYGDDVISSVHAGPGLEVVSRWLRINGDRGFLVVGDGFVGVVLLDPDAWPSIVLTDTLLEWGFYGESGGPCSWDGHAELGQCGPKLWAFARTGDMDPSVWVFRAPDPDALSEEVARFIWDADWEYRYLIDAVGLPGLSEDEVALVGAARDVEGEWVASLLSADLDAQVVAHLAQWSDQLRGAMEALTEPDSARGISTYAWLRQIAHGSYQSASWNDVHAAMRGEIGPPPPNLAPPTMRERWAQTVRSAEAAVAAGLGYAPPVDIPEGLSEEVALAELEPYPTPDLPALIEQLTQETSLAAREHALEVLGCDPDAGVTAAWKAYERLSVDQPDREREVWDAYETILRRGQRQEHLAQAEADLAESCQQEQLLANLDWPAQWSERYAPLWLRLGGTGESAQAWARAGWTVRDVLLERQLRVPWDATVAVRVRTVDVPDKPSTAD